MRWYGGPETPYRATYKKSRRFLWRILQAHGGRAVVVQVPPGRGLVSPRKDQRGDVLRYASGHSVRAPGGSPARRVPPPVCLFVSTAWRSAGHPPKAAAQ